ncbi:hypothetical protein GCM10023194_47650 [Planotetraspora phitsanulokensis]|uniref:Lipoprotein n=1 Tax=Planotetraspora phitsanulokensis TaxID=575192 RepID=A0A8J3XP51_9ACTN|nr:hypothetical protein [Planotetraspora phitsanulokensis]GII43533.1 hypothetical protein Pph01_85360 [Planotetraspora phitsanulokensis]
MRGPLLVASLVLALAGCGSTAPAAAPTSAATNNAAACQQFDKAADQLTHLGQQLGSGEGPGSASVASAAKLALGTMEGATTLARGDVHDAMDHAVAAVQIIQSEAAMSANGMIYMAHEVGTARLAVEQVGEACKQTGVTLKAAL